jgi:CRP-like cAMP-binding protein
VATNIKAFLREKDMFNVSAGDIIFREGEIGDFMYVIVEGEVDIELNGVLIEPLTTGDIFGEMALVERTKPRSATAVAKTDCRLAKLSEHTFTFLVQETPTFALQILQIMSERIRRLMVRS